MSADLTDVREALDGHFDAVAALSLSSEDAKKIVHHALDELEAREGADYWLEIPEYLADEKWYADTLADAGLELLFVGPRGTYCAYLMVRDPGAPPELEGKNVELTVDLVPVDPNASPPVYKFQIVNRKDRHA